MSTTPLYNYRIRVCASDRSKSERSITAASNEEALEKGLKEWATTAFATLSFMSTEDGRLIAQATALPGFLFSHGRETVDVVSSIDDGPYPIFGEISSAPGM